MVSEKQTNRKALGGQYQLDEVLSEFMERERTEKAYVLEPE